MARLGSNNSRAHDYLIHIEVFSLVFSSLSIEPLTDADCLQLIHIFDLSSDMAFVAPAVHYSALTTVLAEPSTWKSLATTSHTTNVRHKLSQVFKRLLHSDDLHERATFSKREQSTPFPTATTHVDRKADGENVDDLTSTGKKVISDPQHTSVEKVSTASACAALMGPLERLPFTEPYITETSNNENHPLDLSAYHKHCIHQESFIARKQYHSQASSAHEHSSTLTMCRLGNAVRYLL